MARGLYWGRRIEVHLPKTGIETITRPLRIDIDVQVSADAEQNHADLSIFNLSDSIYRRIEETSERVRIDAGYEELGGASRIFEGSVRRVWKEKGEQSFITRLILSDTLRAQRVSGGTIGETYAGPTSVRAIAANIVGAMKSASGEDSVQLGDMSVIPPGAVVTDFRAEGLPATELTRLLQKLPGDPPVRWYLDEFNTARFVVGNEKRSDAPRIVKSPSTGIVGSPVVEEDGRLSCTMLLDPRVRLGSEFIIEDSEYVEATPFTVTGIQHNGTNFQGSFFTLIDAVPPGFKSNEIPDLEEDE